MLKISKATDKMVKKKILDVLITLMLKRMHDYHDLD